MTALAVSVNIGQSGLPPLQRRAQSFNHDPVKFHSVAPSHHGQHNREDGMPSQAFIGRTPRQLRTVKLTKRDTAELVATAIQEDYGRLSSRHKQIANDAGAASEKTAEAWTRQQSLPSLDYFLNLGKESPALRAMTLRVWGMEQELDPDFARELNALIQRHLR